MIRQGEIYLFKAATTSGDSKKRPWVIVSENTRNQYSSTVLAVPFTSDRTNLPPTRVLIPRGEGGLAVDSVAMYDTYDPAFQTGLIQVIPALTKN